MFDNPKAGLGANALNRGPALLSQNFHPAPIVADEHPALAVDDAGSRSSAFTPALGAHPGSPLRRAGDVPIVAA